MTSDESAPVTVLAEDWWTYYPLRYLATGRASMSVLWPEDDASAPGAAEPGHRFAVGAADGAFHRWIDRHARELPRRTIVDSGGRAVLHVWDLAFRAELQQALLEAVGLKR